MSGKTSPDDASGDGGPAELIAVIATTADGLMGSDGQLPWHCPEDLKHFKQLTSGHPIIMGRRTFESIGRALPKRTNIVLSRTPREEPEGVLWCTTPEQALTLAGASPGGERAFVIGGKEIYRLFWDRLTAVHHSVVHAPEASGELYFELELLDDASWSLSESTEQPTFRLDRYRRHRRRSEA